MFTSCKFDVRQSLIQLDVSVEIIGVKTFFPPEDLYTGVLDRLDELDRVWLGCQRETSRSEHTSDERGLDQVDARGVHDDR